LIPRVRTDPKIELNHVYSSSVTCYTLPCLTESLRLLVMDLKDSYPRNVPNATRERPRLSPRMIPPSLCT